MNVILISFEEALKMIIDLLGKEPANIRLLLVDFFNDNEWFDLEPIDKDKSVYINKNKFIKIFPRILLFFELQGKTNIEKINILSKNYREQFPLTISRLLKFINELNVNLEDAYNLFSFILNFLEKEILEYNDDKIIDLLLRAYHNQTIHDGDLLISFLKYLKKNENVNFKMKIAEMKQRAFSNNKTRDYFDEIFLKLFSLLTNPIKIEEQKLFYYACINKPTCDAWLYILLHFITAQRDSDLFKIPHPILSDTPEQIIQNIKNGNFSTLDAQNIILQFENYYQYLMPKPNKTKYYKNTPSINFFFPESLKNLFGTLFALAEAHFQLHRRPKIEPLIKQINEYKQIKNYLGDTIGELFLKADFNARAMNKTYMQHIYCISINSYEQIESPYERYTNSAVGRSHILPEYGLSEITNVYIKSPLSIKDIQKMLFERGCCSLETKMTVELLTNGVSRALPKKSETELMLAIPLTPYEQDHFIKLYCEAEEKAKKTVKNIFIECNNNKTKIKDALISIATNEAPSKSEGIMCFKKALNKRCPYPERSHCIFCDYHIFTKSFAAVIAKEIYLHQTAAKESENIYSKEMHKSISNNLMKEYAGILQCIKDEFGEKALQIVQEITKEVLSAYDQ